MKIKDLIELLSKYDPELYVMHYDDGIDSSGYSYHHSGYVLSDPPIYISSLLVGDNVRLWNKEDNEDEILESIKKNGYMEI